MSTDRESQTMTPGRGAKFAAAGMLAAALGLGVASMARFDADHLLAGAWTRAVDGDAAASQPFEAWGGPSAGPDGGRLHPVSVGRDAGKPLVIGDRVTVVAPDGSVHLMRVCDPRSPSSADATDCLNSLVSKAVPAVDARASQRSL